VKRGRRRRKRSVEAVALLTYVAGLSLTSTNPWK